MVLAFLRIENQLRNSRDDRIIHNLLYNSKSNHEPGSAVNALSSNALVRTAPPAPGGGLGLQKKWGWHARANAPARASSRMNFTFHRVRERQNTYRSVSALRALIGTRSWEQFSPKLCVFEFISHNFTDQELWKTPPFSLV